jgi:hypothetical protein
MARQDIAGLLTGISSTQQPVQQAVPGSPNFYGEFMAARGRGLQQGLGGLMRGGEPSTQERIQGAMFELSSPTAGGAAKDTATRIADLTKLARVQQVQGNPAAAAQTAAQVQQLKAEDQAKLAAKIEEKRYQEELLLREREVAVKEGKLEDDGPLSDQAQKAIVAQAVQRNISPEAKNALIEGLKTGVVTKLSDVDEYVETDFDPADVYTKEVSRSIEKSTDLYQKGARGASEADRLLNDIFTSGALTTKGGVFATVTEGVKEFTGLRDNVSYLRTRATKEVNTDIVNSLPPGVASDRDITIFSKGFPNPDTATFEEITEYLEASKRINQLVANDAAFKNYHIASNIKNKRTANLEGYIPASRKFHRGKEELDKLFNEPNITEDQKQRLLNSFVEAFGVLPVEYN